MKYFFRTALLLAICGAPLACAPAKRDGAQPSIREIAANPLPPEEAEELMGEVGRNFIYGQGVGDAVVAVGTTAVFPPFGLWWLGNAVLTLAGYEPLRVSDALPEREGRWWRDTYNGAASGPGRLAAAVAGEEYRTEEVARDRLQPFVDKVTQPSPPNAER